MDLGAFRETSLGICVILGIIGMGFIGTIDNRPENTVEYIRQKKILEEKKKHLEIVKDYVARKQAVADWMKEKAQNPAGHYRGELMKTNGIYYVKNLEAEVSE